MRTHLGDGWSIVLPGRWRRRADRWESGDRALTTSLVTFRCADADAIIADLDAELPPSPAGKVGEPGANGVAVRAAWFYRSPGAVALHGYSFAGDACFGTLLTGPESDAGWAFAVWRSVARG